MASQINPTNIDTTFPIAGQDNDTQGFRTNYINIRNNFTTAAQEITTLQTQVYTNSNVAAYLPTYTGNITAANVVAASINATNLTVANISYVNQEIINTTEIIAGNIQTSTNIITGSIVSPAGSGSNIVIDPDGAGDVILPIQTELFVQSTAANAITVSGGISIAGNVTAGNIVTTGTSINSGIVTGNIIATGTLSVGSAIQFANLTAAQISTISTPARGMTVYNYTSGNIQVYNGTKWANITLS